MTNESTTSEETYDAPREGMHEPTSEGTYEYLLWEICKTPDGILHFELREERPLPDGPLRTYRRDLVPWALTALSGLSNEIGLYYATFAPTDPEGDHTAYPLESQYITWGTGTLAA